MRRLPLGAVVVMVTAALAVPTAQAGPSQRAGDDGIVNALTASLR